MVQLCSYFIAKYENGSLRRRKQKIVWKKIDNLLYSKVNQIESLLMVVQQPVSATTHNRHNYIVHDEVVRAVEDIVNLLFASVESV